MLRGPDELVWLKNLSGEYSTRSCYLTRSEEASNSRPLEAMDHDWLSTVWNIKTSQNIKLFIWKFLHRALPVGEQFAIRNIPIYILFIRCNAEDSISHLLFTCPYAKTVWDLAPFATSININDEATARARCDQVQKLHTLHPVGLEAGLSQLGSTGPCGYHGINPYSKRDHSALRKQF